MAATVSFDTNLVAVFIEQQRKRRPCRTKDQSLDGQPTLPGQRLICGENLPHGSAHRCTQPALHFSVKGTKMASNCLQ